MNAMDYVFYKSFGPGNGSPMTTNVVLIVVLVLGVLVSIRFSFP